MAAVSTFQSRSSFSDSADPESVLSDRLARLVDRVDYKVADSGEEREAIFRLRYQAYIREGGILPNPSKSFSDAYDEMDNVRLIGVYIDDELAGSIRVHLVSKEHPACPSFEAFPDILQPKLDAGKVIVDSTRFVTDENLSRFHRGLAYAILRVSWLATGYYGADYSLAAVRVEHQAFYRRNFNQRLLCEPRPYPGLARPLSLMAIHYPSVVDDVHRRYPFFRSTLFERRMLFERSPTSAGRQSAMLPTNVAPVAERDSGLAG